MAQKNVSLTGKAPPGKEKEWLQQQQALAVAQDLLARGGKDYSAVLPTGKLVVPNIGDMLAELAYTKRGEKQKSEALATLGEMEAQRVKDVAAAMQEYTGTRFGGQDLGNAPAPGTVGPPTQEETVSKPDPLKALSMALSNPHSELQAQGAEQLKGMVTPAQALQYSYHYAPQSLGAAGVNSGQFDPTKAQLPIKEHVVEGQLVGSRDGQILTNTPAVTYQPPRVDPNTRLPGQEQNLTGRVVAQTGGNVTPEKAGEVEAEKTFAGSAIKAADEGRAMVLDNMKKIPALSQLPKLIQASQTGMGADIKNNLRRAVELLGWGDKVDLSKVTNSQTLMSALAPQILAVLKQTRPASDTDREFAQRASLADLSNDPRAMIRAQGLIAADMINQADQHYQTILEHPHPTIQKYQQYYLRELQGADNLVNTFGLQLTPSGWSVPLVEGGGPPAAPQAVAPPTQSDSTLTESQRKLRDEIRKGRK